ncbi:HET-domain-containing protein [Mycena venus]|uniref:HET-domain-containing protein n=1 Tax=Mycena venus TaxID=2733690 RepID=A0A8H6YGD4_9AGAR|nr:HET-domain-containing protein [Mycena venus]
MSGEGNELKTFITNVYGGTGGTGGVGGVTGGAAGAGEGPTMNFSGVQNLTNNIYVGGGLFTKSFLNSFQWRIPYSAKLEEVLGKWLEFPPDTKDRQYHLQSLHHKDTGSWLLHDDRFVKWKATPGSLWIKGISGTGKSVLSSTVIEEITRACPNQSAVAFFYFDFRNEQQRMDIMLRSIIWQLSGRSPSPYSSLERLYKSLGNGTIHPQPADLQGVLEDLLSELDQTYMIIDGLDECRKTDWKPLIEFIHSLQHPTKNALHLLFTSQLFEEFQKAFKDVTFIELGSAVSTRDIRSFVGSTVHGISNWASDDEYAEHVTEQIVQKSNGMFHDWEETLTALPPDLFGIYNRFLTRATDTLKRTVFIQAILRWLVFSARKVTSDELADAIAFRLDDPAFDFSNPAKSIYYPNRRKGNSDIFKLLEGLIMIKDNSSDRPSIALAHSSVKDYILSPQFHQEFGSIIDLENRVSHKFITQTCVRYLLPFADANHLMTKDTLQDYPISLYAANYWLYHLQLSVNQDKEALLPLTMCPLENGSSRYTALYHLYSFMPWYWQGWNRAILPLCICSAMGYTAGVHSLLIEHSTFVDHAGQDGKTALHLASRWGHLAIVQLLIEHSASVSQVDKDGKTALHLALSWGHLDIAQLLIEHSTSVDQADKGGKTVLHLASSEGHLDIVQLLIKHCTSVDQADNDGTTALHLASKKGDLDIVQLLIKHSASVNQADKYGITALHLASSEGHLGVVQLLIEHSTSVNQADKDGKTALHLTLSWGHLDIAQLLIEHSTSVDQADKGGMTALHLALRWGHLEVVQLLIEHCTSVDQADNDGTTALHLTSRWGHLNVLQLLIEHKASVDQADKDGMTALHLASKKGDLDIVQLLIEHSASVNQADKYGITALHLASSEGHLDVVQLLIEHNVSADQAGKDGTTALHLASRWGYLDIVQLLIEHSASVDQADKNGKTALHLALSWGHLDIARLLIEHSTSVDQADKGGRTALHLASSEGHLDIVQLLIEHHAPVSQADKDGKTALHLALNWGHLDITQLLIEHSRSVNHTGNDGMSMLHLTSRWGHLDIIQLLIQHSASVDQATKHGKTALHLDIVKLLIEHSASVISSEFVP